MTRIAEICARLEEIAPLGLAENWDNVGLLVGDASADCERIMTCLTISGPVVHEALHEGVQLLVTHHPLPFRPLTQLTCDSPAGRWLWELIGGRVSIYSAHTAFDSAKGGINQQLGELLGLRGLSPLRPTEIEATSGAGRVGRLAQVETLHDFSSRIRARMGLSTVRGVITAQEKVLMVAVACGSGAEFLQNAHRCGCDTFVTGEASFHGCLEAQALGMNLVLLGHYASERFAMQTLAETLQRTFPELRCWASLLERDPIEPL